jgi:DNA-binding transcriptional regulator YiaG
MVNEGEKMIGARLRAFRETLQIPRSKFAVSIGFGSERIASYEAGRALLPYSVFLAIWKKYLISPHWLATGNAPQKWPTSLDYICAVDFSPRQSFSEVFHQLLSPKISPKLIADLLDPPPSFTEFVQTELRELESIDLDSLPGEQKRMIENQILFAKKFVARKGIIFPSETHSIAKPSNQDLTKPATSSKLVGVKPQLPSLLERLNRATKETGKMSALAGSLKVPLASVSRWLSGKREPGGEITLKLLHWVEQQERQK